MHLLKALLRFARLIRSPKIPIGRGIAYPSSTPLARPAAVVFIMATLAGCGGGSSGGASPAPATTSGTVNVVLQDSPSSQLTVLSFEVQITGAVLQPGNVSLLPKPITVDLAQLVSDTAFLSSTIVGSSTYTSLDLTFANPQVTIVNNSNAPIVTPTQTCAPAAVCTFVPTINTASVTISNGVFPISVTTNSSTGFALDLSIPDLLQSDLSATFANGSSVNLSLLPTPVAGEAQAQIDDVLGIVQSVSAGQVQIKAAYGELLVLTTTASTAYNFPASVCPANDASCVVANQLVTVDLSLLVNGGLQINSITFAGSPGATVAKGIVVFAGTAAPAAFQMLVQRVLPSTATFTPGNVVDVTMQSGAIWSIASVSYPTVSGSTFASQADLLAGQEVLVAVGPEAASGSDGNAAFASASIALESSQIFGGVTSVDSGAQSFALTNVWSLFSALSPAIPQLQVQTGASTSFVNLSPANLTALDVGATTRVKGPLFHAMAGTGEPTLGALQVSGRP